MSRGDALKSTRRSRRLLAATTVAALLTACHGDSGPSSPHTSRFEGRWAGTYTGDASHDHETGAIRFDIRCDPDTGCLHLTGLCSIDVPSCRLQDGTFSAAGRSSDTAFQCTSGQGLAFSGPISISGSQIKGRIVGRGGCEVSIQGAISLRRR